MTESQTTTSPPDFSLVHDPWIPTTDGDVSLDHALRRSRDITAVASGNAAQDVAILRWILAVIYRSYGLNAPIGGDEDAGLDQWETVWNADNLYTDEVATYLDDHAGEMTLRNLLVPEMRSAKDVWKDGHVLYPARDLFPQAVPDAFTPAEVARAALYLNAWNTAGVKTGDPNDPRTDKGKITGTRVGSLGWAGATSIVGSTLHETLCLNWVPILATPEDKPAWELAPFHPCGRDGVDGNDGYRPGVAELLTWNSRRLNARWEDGLATGFMVSRGDNLHGTFFDGAEPMSGFSFNKSQSSKAKVPVYTPTPMTTPGRSWRCMGGMMPSVTSAATVSSGVGEGSPTHRPSEAARWVGMAASEGILPAGFIARMHHVSYEYGTQNAVIDSARMTEFPVPSGALSTDGAYAATVRAAIDYTSDVVTKAIRSFVWAMDIARGGEGDWGTRMTEDVEVFYTALSAAFNKWAQSTTGGAEDLARWQRHAYHTAGNVARSQVMRAPVEAFAGSEHNGHFRTASQALNILIYRLRPTKEDEQ